MVPRGEKESLSFYGRIPSVTARSVASGYRPRPSAAHRRRARVRRYNRAFFVKSSKTTSPFEGGGRGQEGEWGELASTGKKAVGVKLSNQPSPPMDV